MPNVFSSRTLEKFEDASASIPLRRIDKIFQSAKIDPGDDPGGLDGTRRTQFRRYVAGVKQHESEQLDRLGDALGALTGEVADSKVEFLIQAARSDGFTFVDGVFRPAQSAASSSTVARLADLASLDERGKRLQLLTYDDPLQAIAGASELVESLCLTVLRLLGEPLPAAGQLAATANATLDALGLAAGLDTSEDAERICECVRQLAPMADTVAGSNHADVHHRNRGARNGPSTVTARLVVGVCVAFAGYVAEAYALRAASVSADGMKSDARA